MPVFLRPNILIYICPFLITINNSRRGHFVKGWQLVEDHYLNFPSIFESRFSPTIGNPGLPVYGETSSSGPSRFLNARHYIRRNVNRKVNVVGTSFLLLPATAASFAVDPRAFWTRGTILEETLIVKVVVTSLLLIPAAAASFSVDPCCRSSPSKPANSPDSASVMFTLNNLRVIHQISSCCSPDTILRTFCHYDLDFFPKLAKPAYSASLIQY